MTLEPGWLGRQFKEVNEDIALWPAWMRRAGGFMTHVEKMQEPVVVMLQRGDWDVIFGLVTGEKAKVRAECFDAEHEGRKPYLETLERMRREIGRQTE